MANAPVMAEKVGENDASIMVVVSIDGQETYSESQEGNGAGNPKEICSYVPSREFEVYAFWKKEVVVSIGVLARAKFLFYYV